jgi:hypothetical protein
MSVRISTFTFFAHAIPAINMTLLQGAALMPDVASLWDRFLVALQARFETNMLPGSQPF